MTTGLPLNVRVTSAEWPAIREEIAGLLPRFHEAARAYLTGNPERQVDCLRVYIRPDSGMLHFAFDGPKSFYGARS